MAVISLMRKFRITIFSAILIKQSGKDEGGQEFDTLAGVHPLPSRAHTRHRRQNGMKGFGFEIIDMDGIASTNYYWHFG